MPVIYGIVLSICGIISPSEIEWIIFFCLFPYSILTLILLIVICILTNINKSEISQIIIQKEIWQKSDYVLRKPNSYSFFSTSYFGLVYIYWAAASKLLMKNL